MTILDKIKSFVLKNKKVKIDEIYNELSECNKDVIRGTINRYVKREDREFERTKRGVYEVVESNVEEIAVSLDEEIRENEIEDMEEDIVMYHVSLDLNVGEKIFTPSIPKHRCKNENDTIKRISVARTVKDAISGFPYKDSFVNKYNKCQKRLLSVYEFRVKKKDVIFSEDLKDYLPDVHITNECWLVKESVGIGKVIDVKEITLSNYNKYAWYYYGAVNHLIYEESIAKEDYVLTTLVTDKKDYIELLNILDKNNLGYEILDSGRNKFYYLDMGYSNGTTDEKYDWWKISINISKGFDKLELWKMISKIDKKYIDIDAYYKPCGVDVEECEKYDDIRELVDIHLYHNMLKKHGEEYIRSINKSRYNELLELTKFKYELYNGDKKVIDDIMKEIISEII